MNNCSFSKALDAYLVFAESRLSPHTIAEYSNTFQKFMNFIGQDMLVDDINPFLIERFLQSQTSVSKKTRLNYHTGLSALWTWMVLRGLAVKNVVREVKPPKPEIREIDPFSQEDIRLIMHSLGKSKPHFMRGKPNVTRSLPEERRNRAILLLLLDTGIRASELCDLTIKDFDLRNKKVKVFGKGAKERFIPVSPTTAEAIWRYLYSKGEAPVIAPLFTTISGRRLDKDNLRHMTVTSGERAGVSNCHPHRFRHTFAINFLRNGGSIYALQEILGHSSLEMVKRYLQIANADIEQAHRIASPVMNWGL